MYGEFWRDNKGAPGLTKGIGIKATDISAKRVFARLYVRLSYICCVKSGKTAARRFPVQSPTGITSKTKSNTSGSTQFRGAGTYDTCFGLPMQMTHMVRNWTETIAYSPSVIVERRGDAPVGKIDEDDLVNDECADHKDLTAQLPRRCSIRPTVEGDSRDSPSDQ